MINIQLEEEANGSINVVVYLHPQSGSHNDPRGWEELVNDQRWRVVGKKFTKQEVGKMLTEEKQKNVSTGNVARR